MKKTVLYLVIFLVASSLFAQQGINYKAVISENGAVLQNHAVQVQFSVLRDVTTLEYQETQSTTTDANGIIILNIGEGTVVSGLFNSIGWHNSQFLKVEIDTGKGYVDFGTTEFRTVPYAIYAENGGGAKELNDLSDAITGATEINGLSDAISDESSVFLGNNAGINDDASSNLNTGIGVNTLTNNTTGYANNAIGNSNLALGYSALKNNSSGDANSAVGEAALFYNTTGTGNVALGYYSGVNSVGSYNIFIGQNAGYSETGSNKLYIETQIVARL